MASMIRRRMRVTVDGVTHEIITSARDVAAMANLQSESPSAEEQMLYGFGVAHAALMRLQTPDVPHDFDKFVDLLDNIEDLDEAVPVGMPDPTKAAP